MVADGTWDKYETTPHEKTPSLMPTTSRCHHYPEYNQDFHQVEVCAGLTKAECISNLHPECGWAGARIKKANYKCIDAHTIMNIEKPDVEDCSHICLGLKGCIEWWRNSFNRCKFMRLGYCPASDLRYDSNGFNIWEPSWVSKPDLRPDRCTHREEHSGNHKIVFDCRYKNRKDCADYSLKNPNTCFWTTPIPHWPESEC